MLLRRSFVINRCVSRADQPKLFSVAYPPSNWTEVSSLKLLLASALLPNSPQSRFLATVGKPKTTPTLVDCSSLFRLSRRHSGRLGMWLTMAEVAAGGGGDNPVSWAKNTTSIFLA
ncbi:unnamed protein product [Protopolystoma xenopodis]|uniref:Uncharacterized protein n=1 Tax=Protopolystoma xenopodis TaxID=117903 RepID=A0A3S5BNU1_9PLAT|nr:unnamed protein product [Protopolystoma xenopodis]